MNVVGVNIYHCFKSSAAVYGLANPLQDASYSTVDIHASASHGNVGAYPIEETTNSDGVPFHANFHVNLEILTVHTSTAVRDSFDT